MYNYCTLFDSFYLSRALAMYDSLKKHGNNFHLYIFAFDQISYDALVKLNLENITVVSLSQFETPELLEAKKTRTKAEYCWTSTASTIKYVFEFHKVTNCTYIDADLYFYSDPSVLIQEMINAGKNVLITEHRFAKVAEMYELKRAGRFCVQFVTFTNEPNSQQVLNKWAAQCIEWCYSRYEDGKFGDQKYLEPWPDEYSNVHILNHLGGGIAPWNLISYDFRFEKNAIWGKDKLSKEDFPAVFYHFQYVKFMKNRAVDIGWYPISKLNKKLFYIPYISQVLKNEKVIQSVHSEYKRGISNFPSGGIKNVLKKILKVVFRYNMVNSKKLAN